MRNLVAALVLAAALFGCSRSDPIVVIQLHPQNPDIIYVATNDYIYKSRISPAMGGRHGRICPRE